MGAIEPARQAGSTDTKLDQQLDHDGFAVGSLSASKRPWLAQSSKERFDIEQFFSYFCLIFIVVYDS